MIKAKETNEKITNILSAYRSAHRIPGLAAGIILNDEVIYLRSIGTADAKTYQLLTTDTLFAIQDMTTIFTAQAMLDLQNRTNFRVSDTIQTYFPEFDSPELRSLTIQHILQHQTGWTDALPFVSAMDTGKNDWFGDDRLYREKLQEMEERFHLSNIQTRRELAENFPSLLQTHTPGVYTQYNIEPFLLAAAVLEKISSMAWEDYVDTYLFQPQKLRHTFARENRANEDKSCYYINAIGQSIQAPKPHNPLGAPIAGIYSSISDMITFLSRCLQQTHFAPPATPVYQNGWFVNRQDKRSIWSVSGNQLGAGSYMEMIPDAGYGLMLFANLDMLRLSRLGKRIRELISNA